MARRVTASLSRASGTRGYPSLGQVRFVPVRSRADPLRESVRAARSGQMMRQPVGAPEIDLARVAPHRYMTEQFGFPTGGAVRASEKVPALVRCALLDGDRNCGWTVDRGCAHQEPDSRLRGSGTRRKAQPGRSSAPRSKPAVQRAGGLADFDEISVRVSHVSADLGVAVDGRRD